MSYATMDHAAWVESNNAASRKLYAKRKPTRNSYAQAVGFAAAPEKLNDFQARCMDILGIVGGGIYNAPIAWDRVRWNGDYIHVPWRGAGGFATFDFANLSRLTFLAHEARIRVDISVHGRDFLIGMHRRSHQGGTSDRHPSLDEAIAELRAYVPADHRLHYSAGRDDPLPLRRRSHLAWMAKAGAKRAADDALAHLAAGSTTRDAERRRDDLRMHVQRAEELAAMLGGGEELAALVAAIRAQLDRIEAAMPAQIEAAA